jgi:lipopolysaccharide export system permease protein
MIRQYERYIFFHLLGPLLLITLSLTGIIWLTQVLRFIDFMLNRGLAFSDFCYLTGLMFPALLLVIMPISLGIAVVYTINRLTADSELIVLYAVGISKLQLVRPILFMGCICLLICYVLSLYLMPVANTKFQDIRTFFRDKYASVLLEEEVFNSPVDGMTVFIRQRDADNTLHNILLHDNRNPKETVTLIADRGTIEQTASGPRFYLTHGVRQTLRDGRVSWLSFDNYAIDVAFYAKNVERKYKPEERTFAELLNVDGLNEKERRTYRAEAHYRLTWPLFNLMMPLTAMAALFSGSFNRRGQWKRTVVTTLILTGILLLYFALRSMGIRYAGVQPMLYVMILALCTASLHIIARERRIGFSWFSKPFQRAIGN